MEEAHSDVATNALNGCAILSVRTREGARAGSGRASRALSACAEIVECHVVHATHRK